jgi:hypothetical protein
MQQQTLNKKGKESPAFLDLQMMTRTNITLLQKEVVAHFVKALSHYNDKDMLVVPFNMGNCRGLVPWVPRVTGYGPKFWIRSVPSSGKPLGNHTPCIRYGPTTLG